MSPRNIVKEPREKLAPERKSSRKRIAARKAVAMSPTPIRSKSRSKSRSPAKSKSSEMYYEVEEIMDKKIFGRQTKYLVKWLGYPASQSSWEPKRTLVKDCPKIVAAFEDTLEIVSQSEGEFSAAEGVPEEEAEFDQDPVLDA